MTTTIAVPLTGQPLSDSDYVQLSRLITEITWRIDHGHASTIHELFTEDGVLNLGLGQALTGREALRRWGQQFERTGWRIRHAVTNMRFWSAASAARITRRSMSPRLLLTAGARYTPRQRENPRTAQRVSVRA